MKILRSVKRRGSTVASAGFYTVLNANSWFAASRLPSHFFTLSERSKEAVSVAALEEKAQNPLHNQGSTLSLSVMNLSAQDHRFLRAVLVVLAALGVSYALLWMLWF